MKFKHMVSMGLVKQLTVLVTGGAGYIGSHTALELLKEGHDVIVLDSCINAVAGKDGGKPPSLARVEELTGKQITFCNVSTIDKDEMAIVFKMHKIDVVFHFAALKAVGESVSEPLMYYHNNITGTATLLEVMSNAGVKNIVFSSSATVYGTPQYLPMDEGHPTGQMITNPYGQTKFMSEQILKDLTVADPSWRVILLRYFNPVGADESGLIGEDPMGTPNNLLPFISQVAVGKRDSLKVFGNDYDTPDGTGVRDYIHVVDLAKGHVSALAKIYEPDFSGWKAYNLGTGKGISVLEMVKAFIKACGRDVPYEVVGRRPGDLGTVVASCELAKNELNWVAAKNVDDMCEDAWRWQKNNPDGFRQL